MDEEGTTLATEILQELKASARRWFIAFCVMVVVEIATIAGFLYYLSLPAEEYTIEQDTDTGGDNYAVGGNYSYGTTTDNLQTKEHPQETEEVN